VWPFPLVLVVFSEKSHFFRRFWRRKPEIANYFSGRGNPRLKLLKRLIEDDEDRLDTETRRAALAEPDERIPCAEVRRRLGLDDEQEPKRM
jgi:hypothetical protein